MGNDTAFGAMVEMQEDCAAKLAGTAADRDYYKGTLAMVCQDRDALAAIGRVPDLDEDHCRVECVYQGIPLYIDYTVDVRWSIAIVAAIWHGAADMIALLEEIPAWAEKAAHADMLAVAREADEDRAERILEAS